MRAVASILICAAVLSACGQKPEVADVPTMAKADDSPFASRSEPKPVRTTEEIRFMDRIDGLNWNLKEQCAVDICGEPKEEAPVSADVLKIGNQIYEGIRPLIRKAIDDRRASDLFYAKLIQDHRSEFKTGQLDAIHQAAINYLWMMSQTNALSAAWNEEKKEFNLEALKGALREPMTESEVAQLVEMGKFLATSPEFKMAAYIKGVGLKIYFEGIAKTKDVGVVRAKQKEFAQEVAARLTSLTKALPGFPMQISKATLALADGREIQPEELSDFLEDIRSVNAEGAILRNTALFSKRTIFLGTELARYDLVEQKAREIYLDTEKIEKGFSESAEQCRVVAMNIAKEDAAPITFNANQFEVLRNQAIVTAAKLASDSVAADKVRNVLKAAKFTMPRTPRERVTRIVSRYRNISRDSLAKIEIGKHAKFQDIAVFLTAHTTNYINDAGDDHFTMAGPCTSEDPMISDDNSVRDFGVINASYQTLSHESAAYGVLAHELGHVASQSFRSLAREGQDPTFYSGILQCLNARQAYQKAAATTEEDFADLFATKVVAELKKTIPTLAANMCFVIEQNGTRWGSRAGLSMFWPPQRRDRHATDLNRAIQMEIDLGHALTTSCESVVKTNDSVDDGEVFLTLSLESDETPLAPAFFSVAAK